jgi:hypothetical protein
MRAVVAKRTYDDITWLADPKNVIVLANRSDRNFILDLPTGHYRLDAGRRMRTMRSILDIGQIRKLVSDGQLAVEE